MKSSLSDHLENTYLKLARASDHLNSLNGEIKEFFELQPYTIVSNEESSSGDLVYTVIVHHDVPKEFAPMIGDVVHNLRASLDYLIWESVLHNQQNPSRKNHFPICSSKHNFENILPDALLGTSPRTHTLVTRFHPYQNGNDLLWKLHNLDIVDKHRLLLAVGSAHTQLIIQFRMDPSWLDEPIVGPKWGLTPSDISFPLKPGDEVFRIKSQARKTESPLEEPEFVFSICFGDGESVIGEPVIQTLTKISNHIEAIVRLFSKYILK